MAGAAGLGAGTADRRAGRPGIDRRNRRRDGRPYRSHVVGAGGVPAARTDGQRAVRGGGVHELDGFPEDDARFCCRRIPVVPTVHDPRLHLEKSGKEIAMEAITTLYYNAAATAALRMDRLAERGAEKGAMTSTEIAGWTVAVLVIVCLLYTSDAA